MLEIRKGLFETNSSSCHVFCFSKDAQPAVPKSVTLRPNVEDTFLDIWFNDTYCYFNMDPRLFKENIEQQIDVLYSMGVETITCSDNRVQEIADQRKDNYIHYNPIRLACALFGNDTQLFEVEDFLIDEDYMSALYGKECNYFSYRLT